MPDHLALWIVGVLALLFAFTRRREIFAWLTEQLSVEQESDGEEVRFTRMTAGDQALEHFVSLRQLQDRARQLGDEQAQQELDQALPLLFGCQATSDKSQNANQKPSSTGG